MAATDKDTIYIDIDDEITGVIDKVRSSGNNIVALVLPKRASVFQSIVNMKLLKRAADDAKKHLVLITSETGLLPLAGAAGVRVAKTLNSKPEIPIAPQGDDAEETVQEEDNGEPEVTAATAGDQPVGKLAGLGAAAMADDVETVELDDDEAPEDSDSADGKATKSKDFTPVAGKKNKKLHVPNFERFRLLLVLGGLVLILLIIGLVFALNVLPKASINISTDATNINAALNLNLSTAATALDASSNTIPAKVVTQQKSYTQSTTSTGTKNQGTKASGNVTMTAQECAPNIGTPNTVPAGSAVSTGGFTYITQQDTRFNNFGSGKGSCINYQAASDTPINAQNGGTNYNTSNGVSFTVAGRPDVTASGSANGGTDNIIQIVSQADIDNAKSKISTTDATIKQTLQNQLQQAGYYAIPVTFSPGTPTTTNSANVGDAASSVTVTESVTYTMFGVHQSDLKTLVDNNVKSQIDTAKQSVLSEGLNTAVFSVNNSTATTAQLAMQATAEAGPQLNVTTVKQDAAGKKSGDIKSQLQTDPDVTGVTVKLSPFWVTTAPKNTSKITVTIAKPKVTASKTNASSP